MITPEQLYSRTNDGLDILALHYQEVNECSRTGKPFRMRANDKTPSAYVKLFEKNGVKVWKITDFGGDGRATDPISVHMTQTGLRFAEAVLDLAGMFGVTDNISKSVNKPDIRKEPAGPDEEDGACFWDFAETFSDKDLSIMGPKVTADTMNALHWHKVKMICHVKNREKVMKFSNENYPIFMRECWFTGKDGKQDRFYKIYEPLNYEKQFRFSYQPKGKKQQDYINGLEELRRAFVDFNETERASWEADPANQEKPYKERKLQEAVICSGERDALCVRSLGYHPIWFNSETARVEEKDIKEIRKYVYTIYNIPDIDETGRIKGRELALKFIDIHTVWLPDWLSGFRDNRGRPRKDFRDWIELRSEKRDFENLLTLASPAKFWREKYNQRTNERTYSIDQECLFNFLNLNGFYRLKDSNSQKAVLIQIDGYIVKRVRPDDVRNFVITWAQDTAQVRDLRNLVYSTPYLTEAPLEALKPISLDFTNYTPTSQWLYFPDFSLEVTGEGATKHDKKSGNNGRYVWEDRVIDHRVKLMPDMFEITHPEGKVASQDFRIKINDKKSNFFKVLINTSRLFWRKELEYNFEERSDDERKEYFEAHRFEIAGEGLTPEEIAEQEQCLINKIFTIGYIMHRYKSYTKPWAPFVMDNTIDEDGRSNGGSGKSFMFDALANFLKRYPLNGKNPKLLENSKVFGGINKYTDLVFVDDLHEYFPIKDFYTVITSDITIDAKYADVYTLAPEDAPKWAFSTNYPPRDFDGSTARRSLYVVVSDYYHQKTVENDYLETRTIGTDFGKEILRPHNKRYSEEEWNADINFVIQCLRFYLSLANTDIKIEPKMDNIIFRKHLADMSENFRSWAEWYFSEGSENLDRELVKQNVYEDFRRFSGVQKITMQKFTKSLSSYCFTAEHIKCLNPEHMLNKQGRIIKSVEDAATHTRKSTEMIYVQSNKGYERFKELPLSEPPLPF